MNQDDRMHYEIFFSLYKFIREGMEIPPSIRKHCGFADEYRMFEELKKMDLELYEQKKRSGEIPDIDTAYAKLITSVEKSFESICIEPPIPYLVRLCNEMKDLKELATAPKDIDGQPLHFFIKYGIEWNRPEDVIRKQAEAAFGKLYERFVRLTGGRSQADAFMRELKVERPTPSETTPQRKPHITVRPKPKGRKMGL